jgi:DNA-binding GntR family transcriptional regulator
MGRERVTASSLQQLLMQQIIAHICRNDLPKGQHLAEETLAQELDVSRSPVRRALGLLVDRGVVSRRASHGFFLARPAAELVAGGEHAAEVEDEVLYLSNGSKRSTT